MWCYHILFLSVASILHDICATSLLWYVFGSQASYDKSEYNILQSVPRKVQTVPKGLKSKCGTFMLKAGS